MNNNQNNGNTYRNQRLTTAYARRIPAWTEEQARFRDQNYRNISKHKQKTFAVANNEVRQRIAQMNIGSDDLWQTLFKNHQNEYRIRNLQEANRPRRLSQLANGTQTRQNPTPNPDTITPQQYQDIVRLTNREAAGRGIG